ncbi:prepilin peptidase [Rhizobium sp. KVB221]|uniref:Prepilin peptidase n=1 Tax=Rhizobium setariae TaxID=2801340 RepID=A0A936YTV2_9HYPH|nr:prepilin peptidase [Rhizobium setariae]MBL0372717.1 prepilin peptidase [Rhizobium setariae]
MITAVVLVVFPMCMAMAAFSDLLTMTIPNRLSIVLLASFVAIAPFAGLSLHDFALHLGAGAAVFAAGFALFAFGTMGGGDAKILTASAVWFGFNPSLLVYMSYVGIFGGLLSLLILTLRANHNLIIVSRIPVPQTMLHAKKVPYGIAIGAAAFAAFPSMPLVRAVTGLAH